MKTTLVFVVLFLAWAGLLNGQSLFEGDDVVNLTISGNLGELLRDRGDDPQYHTLSLSYQEGDQRHKLNTRIKVRGHFRKLKENCNYPPLLLNFSEAVVTGTLFDQQNQLKLVTPCRGDKYVVREYLVYKLYNLISPRSFRARLVKVIYEDSVKQKKTEPLFGILLEDEDQMAARNSMKLVDAKLVRPDQTVREDFLRMAVFQYMIGNTDWSVQYLQNIKLIMPDSARQPFTVPYDFDHAGIVDAPYAHPAEELLLASTRVRRYRGFCIKDMAQFDATFSYFRSLEQKFYEVFSGCAYLEEGYKKSTVKYLEEFFKTINSPKDAAAEFGYPCQRGGTGNVVIMGLEKNQP